MERRRRCAVVLVVAAALADGSARCRAQTADAPASEELEPRIVGAAGVTTIGLSGFADKLSSSEDVFPWRATGHLELTRFVTRRLAARVGLLGSTTADGLDDDERITAAAPAFYASTAVLCFITPGAMLSPYTGVEYRARLTERPAKDAGSASGVVGLQATVSSRTSLFVETSFGADLTRGSEGELRTRFSSAVGIRIRF